jgi:hypothetical protein
MVQIIQGYAPINTGGQIGSALGQGLQQGLNTSLNQQYQRGQLQNALGQLKNIPQGANPLQLATALLSATAGLPDQGKLVASLFPLLQQQAAGKDVAQVGPPGNARMNAPQGSMNQFNQNPNQMPQIQGQQQQQQNPIQYSGNDPTALLGQARRQMPNLPAPTNTPDIFKGTLNPTELGLGPIPNTYNEDEIASAEQQDLALGRANSPRADFMRNYNDTARKRINDIVQAAQTHANISESVAKRQADFREVLKEQIHTEDPSDLAVAETIASRPEYKNIANDKIRAERVAKEFQEYEAGRDEFTRSARRPNPVTQHTQYNTSLKNLHNLAEPLIKNGQRSKAYEILAKNDWSESEIAKTLNPLDQKLEKQLNTLPMYQKPTAFTGDFPIYESNQKENSQVDSKWEKFLEKSIKPGQFDPKNPDVIEPGTSLILLRNAAIKKGMPAIVFDNILNKLKDEKKITLDPQQQKDLNFTNQSPSRTWSLYELLIGGPS